MYYVKYVFLLIILCSFIFVKGQTWQSAYDSCIKYQEKQQYKKAIKWGSRALDLYEKQVSIKDTTYSNILNKLFDNCKNAGLYKQAEIYAKKDSIWARQTDNKSIYSNSCNNLGLIYNQQGRYSESELLYKEAKAIREKIFGKEHYEYAITCNNLALLYYNQGRYNESEALYKEAKAIVEKVLGKKHPDYAMICNNLAGLYEKQNYYSEAELLHKEAKTIIKALGKKHLDYAQFCNNLAALYYKQGRYGEAEVLYQEAKMIREKVLGKEHLYYAVSCNNLATWHC